ncbi:hypothetical protein J3R83DRAFT_2844 [Lanmaoa asiatica]|nr:hypothetical protein J3R83DRAFT_2844 [Lanmaoa asiatica]
MPHLCPFLRLLWLDPLSLFILLLTGFKQNQIPLGFSRPSQITQHLSHSSDLGSH